MAPWIVAGLVFVVVAALVYWSLMRVTDGWDRLQQLEELRDRERKQALQEGRPPDRRPRDTGDREP